MQRRWLWLACCGGLVGATTQAASVLVYLDSTNDTSGLAVYDAVSNLVSWSGSAGSTIAGGKSNAVSGAHATVGGGFFNGALAAKSTVAGGAFNGTYGIASSIGGGAYNTAAGLYGTVPGGVDSHAGGDYSFAAGRGALATNLGSFVWADASPAYIGSRSPNEFLVRASGGVRLYSDAAATTGARLAPGSGSWSTLSDRASKTNFVATDPTAVLDALATLPVSTWNYRAQDEGVRHMGPVAQDFHAAFGLGECDTSISTVDADGVALAAIQGLYELVRRQQAELEALRAELRAVTARGTEDVNHAE